MYQNYVDGTSKGRQMMSGFGGLNQNVYCQPNEFRDMVNLSSDAYPYLTQRAKRNETDVPCDGELKASLIHDGKLAAVIGTDLFYYDPRKAAESNEKPEPVVEKIVSADEKCHLVANGAELYVFPQGIAYNTISNESRTMSAEVTVSSNEIAYISYIPCNSEGKSQEDGKYFKMLFANEEASTNEQKEMFLEKFSDFRVGDGVRFSGYIWDDVFPENTYSTIVNIGYHEKIETQNEKGEIKTVHGLYFVFRGDITASQTYYEPAWPLWIGGAVYISKEIPVLDFYTVCQNRVWGCVYKDGLNEIRCSKLGDPSNWNTFMGVSTDSFTASVGEEGPFTGIFAFNDEPYFFKENVVLKVYGGYPAAYQVYAFSCSGVQEGSEHGITSSEGYLFYKTPNDFCVFSGSQPQSISKNLGFEKYHDVVAGAVGGKIYWSCLDKNDQHILLVYDQATGVWYKEESARVFDFCQDAAGHLLGISAEKIINFEKKNAQEGEGTEWFAETGLIGLDVPDQKAVTKYTIRAEMEAGATLSVMASYDDGEFEPIYHCIGEGRLSSHTFAVRPIRCDHLRLRLEGVGKCTIYSIAYTMEQRSENP